MLSVPGKHNVRVICILAVVDMLANGVYSSAIS